MEAKRSKKATQRKPDPDPSAVQLGDEDPVDQVDQVDQVEEKESKKLDHPGPGPALPTSPKVSKNIKIESVVIRLAVAEIALPTISHLDLDLGAKGKKGLKKLLAGCITTGARLDSGKLVNTASAAAKWLIEQVDDACIE